MSVPDKADLEAKLKKLECPFTWDMKKTDIKELVNISEKLLDRVKFCPRIYHPTYLNILSFLSHLEGNNERALEFLIKAETVLKNDSQDKTYFLVNYANFAWVHFYAGNLSEVETYLGKLEKICEDLPLSLQDSCSVPAVNGEKAWTFLRLGATYYESAKESFQKALEGEPDNVSYNMGYAVVLYRLEGMNKDLVMRPENSEAVTQLKKTLVLEPSDSEAMVLLALKLQGSSKQESLKLIKDALRLSPDVPQVTRYAAKYFRVEGSIEESLEILRKAVELAPNSSFLHHQIGLCHKQQLIQMSQTKGTSRRVPQAQKKSKVAECIHYFRKAVNIKPSNTHAQVNLAEAYAENRQLEQAEMIFTELLRDTSLLDSDRQHCHTSYGLFLLHKKKAENLAISQFKAAYQLQTRWARNQAGRKLHQIAARLKTQHRDKEALEILAFMSTEDEQERQASAELDLALDRGMKLKLVDTDE